MPTGKFIEIRLMLGRGVSVYALSEPQPTPQLEEILRDLLEAVAAATSLVEVNIAAGLALEALSLFTP